MVAVSLLLNGILTILFDIKLHTNYAVIECEKGRVLPYFLADELYAASIIQISYRLVSTRKRKRLSGRTSKRLSVYYRSGFRFLEGITTYGTQRKL